MMLSGIQEMWQHAVKWWRWPPGGGFRYQISLDFPSIYSEMMIMNWPSYPWDWLKPPARRCFYINNTLLSGSKYLPSGKYLFCFSAYDMKSPENVGPMSWWCQVVSQEVHASTLRPSWGRFGMARQAPSWSKFEILANLLADRSFSICFVHGFESILYNPVCSWPGSANPMAYRHRGATQPAMLSSAFWRLGPESMGHPFHSEGWEHPLSLSRIGGIHAGTNPQIMFAWSWLGLFWLGGP